MRLTLVDDDGVVIATFTREANSSVIGDWRDASGDWAFQDGALPGDLFREIHIALASGAPAE